MKTILLTSAVSVAIGFTFGWLVRSTSLELDSNLTANPTSNQASPAPRPTNNPAATDREKPDRPRGADASPITLLQGTAAIPETHFSPDRGKWMRLIELLGLDDAQAQAIQKALTELRPTAESGMPLDAAYTQAGIELEKRILQLLNSDQQAAFIALQARTLENRSHASALETYAQELADLDLSPDQQQKALSLLRTQAEQASSDIPPATRLLLQGSFLPVGDERLSEHSIRLMRQIASQNNGDATLESIAQQRRAEADAKLREFETILTPAQLELYRAKLAQTPDILDQIRTAK